jgi:hypothetical protein
LNHSVVYTTIGTKPSIDLDPAIAPFNATVAVTVVTGPASFKLQYTIDDFTDPLKTDASANWFDSTEIPAATAASIITVLNKPVTRVRLVIATLTAGSLQLQTQQGLSTN